MTEVSIVKSPIIEEVKIIVYCGGTTKKGTPCKYEVQKNTRCKWHHKEPITLEQIIVTESKQIDDSEKDFCGGTTKTGSPCKYRVPKGDKCKWHKNEQQKP